MRLAITPAFDRYIIAEPIASFVSRSCEGHGVIPNHDIVSEDAPMWKFTGIANSAHTSHNGFQYASPRSGSPKVCGPVPIFTPRNPSPCERRISRTATSTSHIGVIDIGNIRCPDSSCNSADASLKISTARRRRSSSGLSTNRCPPKPTVLGYTICAHTPCSSMYSRRGSTRHAP